MSGRRSSLNMTVSLRSDRSKIAWIMPYAVMLAAGGALLGLFALLLFGGGRSMTHPKVPQDKLAEARALTNPLLDSPEVIAKGKALYEGKGACFNCHGTDGMGKGPYSVGLDPSPRNFHHPGFWRHRTDGEISGRLSMASAGR
jgi:hypothetical protein